MIPFIETRLKDSSDLFYSVYSESIYDTLRLDNEESELESSISIIYFCESVERLDIIGYSLANYYFYRFYSI